MPSEPAPPAGLEPGELERIDLFRDVDPAVAGPLLAAGHVRAFQPGEVVIEAGIENRSLFLLLDGRLSIRVDGPSGRTLALVDAGESVGELSAVDHRRPSAWVVVEAPSRVLVLDNDVAWRLVESSHAFASNLIALLVRRMRSSTQLLAHYGHQIDEYRLRATVDVQTGLYNRRWVGEVLPRHMERARVSGERLSVLIADIDHFKRYNDTYGHPGGDAALCTVADAIVRALRPTDLAARYGGEEFLVLLPGADLDAALKVAERLRAGAAGHPVHAADGSELPGVTLSIGAAELAAGDTPERLIERTDRALYRAKRTGRDRVKI